MIRIYRRLWHVNWAEQWQYRANQVMYLLYWIVSPLIYLSVWTSVARAQGSVSGLTANDFVTYYMMLLIVDILASDITAHILAYKIQDGTLSAELLKPVHPVLTTTLVNNLAFKMLTVLAVIPIWTALHLLFRPDFGGVTATTLLLAAPALVFAFAIGFLLSATVISLAFWTTRVYAIHELYFAVLLLFSGQFAPLDLMPRFVQEIAQFLPFQLMRYFPIQLILGRLEPWEIARSFAADAIWLGLALALFAFVWRRGLKRFSAVGA